VIQLFERMRSNRRRSLILLLLLLLLIGGCSATMMVGTGSPAPTAPVPLITSTPSDPTSATTATFRYTDSSGRALFRCSIDGSRFEPCPASGITYRNLDPGAHEFRIEASLGRSTSEAATFHWTILSSSSYQPVRIPAPTVPLPSAGSSSPPSSTQPTVTTLPASSSTPTSSATTEPVPPTTSPTTRPPTVPTTNPPTAPSVAGNLGALLYPGVSHVLDLIFTNPNSSATTIAANGVGITISTNRAGCPAATNFRVSRGLTTSVTIPAKTAKSLAQLGVPSTDWPVIAMIDTHTNQDACQNATLTLSYSVTVAG
jgi:hypothetical protein